MIWALYVEYKHVVLPCITGALISIVPHMTSTNWSLSQLDQQALSCSDPLPSLHYYIVMESRALFAATQATIDASLVKKS